MRRLRPLSEAECYARCYGSGEETVRFMKVEPRRTHLAAGLSGEDLRRAFEQKLERREPDAPASNGSEQALIGNSELSAAIRAPTTL